MSSSLPTFTGCDGFTARPSTSIRPASSASLASVRRLAKRETLRNLSSLMVFGTLPEHVEVFQTAARQRGGSAAGHALHGGKALPELDVGEAQCGFGVDTEPARKIDERE